MAMVPQSQDHKMTMGATAVVRLALVYERRGWFKEPRANALCQPGGE